VLVSSEHPFATADAVTTIREYNAADGHLVRVFRPDGLAEFRQPRGLRFGSEGQFYCVAQDEVVAFDFATGRCLGTTVRLPRLNGQALALLSLKSIVVAQSSREYRPVHALNAPTSQPDTERQRDRTRVTVQVPR
jgi:hypothetical protein